MSQRDGFGAGFLLGTIVGGVVGGIIGAVVASRSEGEETTEASELTNGKINKNITAKSRQMFKSDGQNWEMESARRSLEDKIAQLNATIDEVRQQLSNVNTSSYESNQSSSITEEF